MTARRSRSILFWVHRYLGLILGLIIIAIGVTGSMLVFHKEIDNWLVARQFGEVTPQAERVELTALVNNVKASYPEPDFKLSSLGLANRPNLPYQAWVESTDDKWMEVFVNPYTGKILGDRAWDSTFFSWIFKLHYQLLAGDIGTIIAGIAALFWVILCITGIAHWPGWRKLINGFKIKWNAHPQRVNFDVHKVTGIVVAVFLAAIAFTGFCWNFYEHSERLIYKATLTPQPPKPVSQVRPEGVPLAIEEIVQRSQGIIPDTQIQSIQFPQSPDGAFRIRKKPNQSPNNYGQSEVYLDQYSGEVLQVSNELKPSRAEAVMNTFMPIHYGTFWGLPSRIFYLFVGIAPLILFVTGLKMGWYRGKRKKDSAASSIAETSISRR